jgi:orotate phosphoribosyltransferase
MEPYQQAFIELLVRHEVLRFGDFTLKSGRRSPYFVNAGQFRTGAAISGLGRAYAECLRRAGLRCDLLFGPSYKGVPLAVATAIAMAELGQDAPFCFDRKEHKEHGEGGWFVGTAPQAGMRVVIVDDVITSGKSIHESVELLRRTADVQIAGVVVAVDRQERGAGERTTLAELQGQLGVPVCPIVTIRDVIEHLHGREVDGARVIDDERRAAMEAHLAAFGGAA